MARIAIEGIGIEYELIGPDGAQSVAITPGGRSSKDAPGIRELADALVARGRRVLLWDRPNGGKSGLCFDGESEGALSARVLTGLIRALDLGPTALVGGSAGSRCSLLAAAHDPDSVSHLVQWWVSGGTVSLTLLAAAYYCEPAAAAIAGGMEAAARAAIFAEPLRMNPDFHAQLLALDPTVFVEAMERWAKPFLGTQEALVPGLSRAGLSRLAMPVTIVRGSPRDAMHNASIAEALHALIPHSRIVDAPWSEAEFLDLQRRAALGEASHYADWQRLAPLIADFTER